MGLTDGCQGVLIGVKSLDLSVVLAPGSLANMLAAQTLAFSAAITNDWISGITAAVELAFAGAMVPGTNADITLPITFAFAGAVAPTTTIVAISQADFSMVGALAAIPHAIVTRAIAFVLAATCTVQGHKKLWFTDDTVGVGIWTEDDVPPSPADYTEDDIRATSPWDSESD